VTRGAGAFGVVVLVSGEGTNLQAILDTIHGADGIEVRGVASSSAGARALERAERAGVPSSVFDVAGHEGRVDRDRALGDWIDEQGGDLVVLAGFMELLSGEFVRRFEGRVVNVHPALLPSFPGLRAIEQAIEHGVRVTGVTVHFVDEGVDSGPIILQEAIPLAYARDIEGLEQRLHEVEHRLLPEAIRLIARGAVSFDPENPRRVVIDEPPDAG